VLTSLLWVTLLYGPAIKGGFSSYDDAPQITQNPALSSLSGTLKYFRTSVSFSSDLHGSGESFYRPIFWLSLAMDKKLWGFNPVAFHFTNLLLHWMSGLFLFLLLRRLHISSLSSAATSLLWLSLPINCEAVAWISGRPYCLAACFLLLGMLLADEYLSRPRARYLVGFCLAASCALLSHEEGVLLVALTFLLIIAKHQVKSRAAIMLNGASVITTLLYFWLRHAASATGFAAKGAVAPFGLFFWKYFGWMVLPVRMSMERSTDTPSAGWSGHALAAWLCLALAFSGVLVAQRKVPRLLIGFAWMVIGLLPFCGIVSIYQGMAERYTYIASAGLALTVVLIAEEARGRWRPLSYGFVVAWLLWGVYRLETRIPDWSDAALLYAHSLQADPGSPKLHYNLGAVLEERREFAQARPEYKSAIDLQPSYEPAIAGLGNVYLNLGSADEASEMFEKALELKPDDVKAVTNYGTALQSLGKIDAAKTQYQRAISLAPDNDDAYCDLGALFVRDGDLRDAVLEFNLAAKTNPEDPVPLFNLAGIFRSMGRPDLAIKLYEQALQLNPGDPDTVSALQSTLHTPVE
jgi:protein O-mannosyl-transferase